MNLQDAAMKLMELYQEKVMGAISGLDAEVRYLLKNGGLGVLRIGGGIGFVSRISYCVYRISLGKARREPRITQIIGIWS